MKLILTKNRWPIFSTLSTQTIGFVPTMGALHEGHISLVKSSLEENDKTVVSIFVNPTQFNDKNDFKNYPIHIEEDIKILEELNVDYLFLPSYEDLYPDEYKFKVIENDFSKQLCGKNRPGHFDGVLTIVMKLLNIVSPNKAYFGEKDFQQLQLIKDMVETFFMNVEIISKPIIRDKNGLALSSRNKLLSETEKNNAAKLYKTIKSGKTINDMKQQLEDFGFSVDYIEKKFNRIFVAVNIGKVRLIDNVII